MAEFDAAAFDGDSHWISDVVEAVPVGHPLAASVLAFGTLPNLLLVAHAVARGDELSTRFLLSIVLTVAVLNVGPFLVWNYDQRVLPEFFRRATELLPEDRLLTLASRYDAFFARRWWPTAVGLAALMGYTFVRAEPFLVRAGVFEAGGPFQYAIFAMVVWAGVLGGVGFHGVLTTLLVVRQVSREDLSIDPLHPDKLGGLSVVGYYAIRTTLLFSSASLFIPLAYQFIALSEYASLIYVIVGLYSLFLLLSFVVPTVQVNRRANELRASVLEDLRAERATIQETLSSPGAVGEGADQREDELVLELQAQRVRSEYEDYKQVQLYPMEIQILARLVGSVLLPLGFLLLELTLPQVL